MTRGFLPLLGIISATGLGALSWATDGFRVITTEGALRLAIERAAERLPDIRMTDQTGAAFGFTDYRGKTVLVDFIYTNCPTICGVLGDDFHNVLALARRGTNPSVELLSISFDPDHDDREALNRYAGRYGAVPPDWRIAVAADRDGLGRLLHAFGAVVIPDGSGGFVHTAAVYVVSPSGRIVRILDPEAPRAVMAAAIGAAAE